MKKKGAIQKKRERRLKGKKDKKETVVVDEDDSEGDGLFEELPLDSVVKIYSTLTPPVYTHPWQMAESEDCTGSGFIIKDRMILTNAHVVETASFVMVRAHGQAQRFKAEVVTLSSVCDLAVLRVDAAFWEQKGVNLQALKLSRRIPPLQSEITVAGYPMGGDSLSCTFGIVSRIEDAPYDNVGEVALLNYQVDASINPGNSGGPCFLEEEVCGVAFSGLDEGEGLGYCIPSSIVEHFLKDIELSGEAERFRGFCSLGLWWQTLENPSLKASLGCTGHTGVLVRAVDPLSVCQGLVQANDVLLSVNGHEVADDGTFLWRKKQRQRLYFGHLVHTCFPGDLVRLVVWREDKQVPLEVVVNHVPTLVATRPTSPNYVTWAGLVFTPLSIAFLNSWTNGEWNTAENPELVAACLQGIRHRRKFADQEHVVLSVVLRCDVNITYEDYEASLVRSCNGTTVRNLAHLWQLVQETPEDSFVRLALNDDHVIVIRKRDGDKADQHVALTHKVNPLVKID